MLESLFNKIRGLQGCNFIKETSTQVFSCEICEISKKTYFEEYLRTATSGSRSRNLRQEILFPVSTFLLFWINWKDEKLILKLCANDEIEIEIQSKCDALRIWYHLWNFKNVKNTGGGVLLTKSNAHAKAFFTFLNCTNGIKSRKGFHINMWNTRFFISNAFFQLNLGVA